MYKIIFSDADGTLLNKDHTVSTLNKYAVNEVIKKGIPFVVISGRSPEAIRLIHRLGNFKSPMICYGGCLMLDENENIIFNVGIDKTISNEILNYVLNKYDNVTYCIYTYDNWYTPDRSNSRIKLEECIVQYNAIEGDMSKVIEPLVNKMLLICDKDKTDIIENDLKNKYPNFSFVKSSDIQIEIMPKGINKGDAIEKFCSLKGYSLKDAMAFGDHFNDETMFNKAGTYFLMDNAPKLLKEKYLNHTESNDKDGIYHALVKIGLINKK